METGKGEETRELNGQKIEREREKKRHVFLPRGTVRCSAN